MASPEKRCYYDVLGLRLDSTADEIRSAYKKLALQRHPDKLMQSGLSEAEATASFQELVSAYEVLSDPRERAWYDSHRSQILFSSSNPSNSNSSTSIPNLFSFFSNSVFSSYSDKGKGFYKVYGDIFDKIYQNELNFAKKLGLGLVKEAPVLGNFESPYSQVNAFYGYWLGFATVMDFVWVDQYDAMAGPNRKSRRVMEEENKKLRKKAKREYNETVRGLAEFAKKRDKRVIDMQMKRNEEMERKKEEEKERKKQLEREKAERVRAYEEPGWAKIEELEEEFEEVADEGERKEEFYCVVCSKKFKSEKQWNNHEQSKKHKEKVAELREAFGSEDGKEEEEEGKSNKVEGNENHKQVKKHKQKVAKMRKDFKDEEEENEVEEENYEMERNGFVLADDEADDLRDEFENGVGIKEENGGEADDGEFSENESFVDTNNGGGLKEIDEDLRLDDDEASVLKAMLSGHKNRKNKNLGKTVKTKASSAKLDVDDDSNEMEFMEYNDRKGSRKNKGRRRERGRRDDEEATKGDDVKASRQAEEHNQHDNDSVPEETTSSFSYVESEANGIEEDQLEKNIKVSKPAADKKGSTTKDTTKSKNASKGRKQKTTSKASSLICEKCGEDFESRNKLHQHLSYTRHATLRSQ